MESDQLRLPKLQFQSRNEKVLSEVRSPTQEFPCDGIQYGTFVLFRTITLNIK